MPTAKLDVCGIKFKAAHPDGVIKKRPTIDNNRRAHYFWKIAQNLSCWKVFGATFFQKGSKKSLTQTNFYSHIAFSFGTKGAKEKALQKENAVFMGRCPKPHSLFEKSETKNF